MPLLTAEVKDIPELVALINSAYRGEVSKQGWTTEADLLKGEARTDIATLTSLMEKPSAVILKWLESNATICGSVYLDIQEKGLYLGMLTVSPTMQDKGIGKQLMHAAEDHAKKNNCACIFMNVISIRYELVAWYERLGFKKNGEVKPVPSDPRYGVTVMPLEFHIMQKDLASY